MTTEIFKKKETFHAWVQIVKGLGIILVVISHFSPNTSPEYWLSLREIIYLFHMPLFFFLSGFLFRYEKYPYLLLVKTKINRLLFPYIFILSPFSESFH